MKTACFSNISNFTFYTLSTFIQVRQVKLNVKFKIHYAFFTTWWHQSVVIVGNVRLA